MNARLTFLSLLPVILLSVASAGEPYGKQEVMEPVSEPGWEYTLAVYGFLAGAEDTLTVGGQSIELEADFGDLLANLDFASTIAFEMRRGKFSLLNDFLYFGLSPGRNRPGATYDIIAAEIDAFLYTGLASYRFFESEDAFLEFGGGLRLFHVRSQFSLFDSAGVAPSVFRSNSSTIYDGVGAIQGGYKISDRWDLRFYGDIGAGDSRSTWQVWGNLNYRMSETKTLFLGYRHMEYEFTKGPAALDMSFSGPQLGMLIRF